MAETKTINLNVETNIDELTSKLNDVNIKINQLLLAEENDVKTTKNLVNQKKILQQQLKELNTVVKNNSDNIRTNTTNIVGFGNSVNQISRELPAFTNSLNTGFMAISNNLPILFDEINKVKQANVELAASGQPTVSVFKTLVSSIFSFGTALSLGVTLLTVYGGKIVEYFTKDNEQRKTNVDLIKKQNEAVAKESSEFVQLIGALKETNKNSEDRKRLISQINDQYGTTLKNISDEKLFQEQLNTELKTYIEYQTQKFKFQQYEKAIQNNLAKQSQIRRELAKEQTLLNTAEDNYNKIMSTGGDYMGLATKQYENQKAVVNKLKNELKDAEERLSNYNKASLSSSNIIDKLTNGGDKYGKQLDERKKKIKEVTEEIDTSLMTQDKIEELWTQQLIDEDNKRAESQKKLLDEKKADEERYIKWRWTAYWETTKFEEEQAEKRKKLEKDVVNSKIQIAQDSLALISNITTLFGQRNEKEARKAFQVDKAAKLASATISGIEGTINAYTTAQKSPITALFPAYPVIQAGLAGAFAAVNIAKISQSQFQGGNNNIDSNAPTGATTQSMTPTFNIVGGNPTSQLLQGLSMQPLKAYVVASDITTAQMLEQKAIKTSVL